MRFLFAFIAMAAAAWGGVGCVQLNLTDRSGQTRTGEVVTWGVSLAQTAAVTDVRNLELTTSNTCAAGSNIDSHLLVTARWGGAPTDTTKPIRYILADFHAPTLTGSGTAAVYLADRVGSDPGTAQAVTVTTDSSCSASCTVVDTGSVTFKFRGDYFNGPAVVSMDGGSTLVNGTTGGFSVVAAGVTYTSASAGDGTVPFTKTVLQPTGNQTANEAGENLKFRMKVTGALWAGAVKKFRYVAYVTAGGGGTWLQVDHDLVFSEDMFAAANLPTDISFVLPSALGSSKTALYGIAYGTEGTTFSHAFTTADEYLSQYDDGDTFSPLYQASSEPGFYIGENSSQLSALSTYHQADGWLDVSDASNGITMFMREFWHQYPVGLESNGSTLSLHFWDPHIDTFSDATNVWNYKRDQALAGAVGFQTIWPYAAGGTMAFAPLAPNPNRNVYSATNSSPPQLEINWNNFGNANGDHCIAGTGCNYWPTGAKHRVYFKNFQGTCTSNNAWACINGYQQAAPTGATGSHGFPLYQIYDSNGNNSFDSTNWGAIQAKVNGCGIGTELCAGSIDTQTDMQADSVAKTWEFYLDFHSGAGTPGNDVAKMRDRLVLTNPQYYADTTWGNGRFHCRETSPSCTSTSTNNFSRADALIDAAWSNMAVGGTSNYTLASTGNQKNALMRNYGMWGWGETQYADPGEVIAGFGGRYYSRARKDRTFAPWIQFLRTGDPTFWRLAESWTWNVMDTAAQHPPSDQLVSNLKTYVDANSNYVSKLPGSHYCTHGLTLWFPTYEGLAAAGHGGSSPPVDAYDCQEAAEFEVDEWADAMFADYVLSGCDLCLDRLKERASAVLWSATAAAGHNFAVPDCSASTANCGNTAFTALAGRAFNGCFGVMTTAFDATGGSTDPTNYLGQADACMMGGIEEKTNQPFSIWYQNPTGYIPSQNPGNTIGWSYFTDSWPYYAFSHYAEMKGAGASVPSPAYATLNKSGVNVQNRLVTFGKSMSAMFTGNTQTGAYIYQWPGAPIAYAYHYSGDATLLTYMKEAFDKAVDGADTGSPPTGCNALGSASTTGDTPLTTCTLNYAAPALHQFNNFVSQTPFLMYELKGLSPALPSLPVVWMQVPVSGAANAPLKAAVNKTGAGAWSFDLFFDTKDSGGSEFEGAPHPLSGNITVDLKNPSNASVSGFPQTFKTANSWWPVVGPPGTTTCGSAPDAPSITFNGVDQRDFHFAVPEDGLTGEYTVQISVVNGGGTCASWHDVAVVASSLGNWDWVAAYTTASQFSKTENGSRLWFKVPNGTTKLQVDSSNNFTIKDPNGNRYKGQTNQTVPLVSGIWSLEQYTPWTDLSAFVLSIGGVKPLFSPSSAYFYDSPNYGTQTFVSNATDTLTLNFPASGCAFTTISPLSPTGTIGVVYGGVTFAVNGSCNAVSNWASVPATPCPGLSLNSGTGALSGTPTGSAGVCTFVVTATDGVTNPSKSFSLTINPAAAQCTIVNPNSPLPTCQTGVACPSVTIGTSNCVPPITWSIPTGSLPNGLTLDSALGIVSGTPTVAGTFNFTIQAVDSQPSTGSQAYAQSIITFSLTAPTTDAMPQGHVGVAFQTVTFQTSGGTTPITFAASGSLPPGLTLNSSGILAGTPTVPGQYTFTVTAKDALNFVVMQTYTVAVVTAGNTAVQ